MLVATLVSVVILAINLKKFEHRSVQQSHNAIFQNMLTAVTACLLFLIFKTSIFESFAEKAGIPYSVLVNLKDGSIYVSEMFCFSDLGIWLAVKKHNDVQHR